MPSVYFIPYLYGKTPFNIDWGFFMQKKIKKNKKRFGYVKNYSYIYKVIKVKQLKHKTK